MILFWVLFWIFCILAGGYSFPGCWVGSLFFSVVWIFCFQAACGVRGIFSLSLTLPNVTLLTCPHSQSLDSLSPAVALPSAPQGFLQPAMVLTPLTHDTEPVGCLAQVRPGQHALCASSPSCSWHTWVVPTVLPASFHEPRKHTAPGFTEVPAGPGLPLLTAECRISGWSRGPLPLAVPSPELQNTCDVCPHLLTTVVFWSVSGPKRCLSCFQEHGIFF